MNFLFRWLISSGTTLVIFPLAQGVVISSLHAALMLAVTLGLLNAAMPYIISMFSFTSSILTLGLFTLGGNSFLLSLAERYGFGIRFGSIEQLLLVAIMISVITWFTTMSLSSKLILK